jgi:hypothetical protein
VPAREALETGQAGVHCQPQRAGEQLRGTGGREGQFGEGRYPLTLQWLVVVTVKPTGTHLAAGRSVNPLTGLQRDGEAREIPTAGAPGVPGES